MQELKEKIPILSGYKIKASGVFDFEELYQELERWFKHNGYEWKETTYRNVDQPDGGKMVELKWECYKKPSGEDYLRYQISIHWQAFLKEVEVNVENIKRKMNKGSVEMRFEVNILKGVKVWEKMLFGKLMGVIYEKILIRDRLDKHEEMIFEEANALFSEIRAFFQIYGAS